MIGALGLFALLRVAAWDSAEPIAVVDALAMVVYLPAWIIAIGAIAGRRWPLGIASLIVVAAQVAFVAPELLAAAPLPSWARHAPTLRLFDANVDKSKEFGGGYGPAIDHFRPDLVTLEEFTPPDLRALRRSGALAPFRFLCAAPQYGPKGFFVASRFPMTGCKVHSVRWKRGLTPYMLSATIDAHGSTVELLVVHTLAPFPAYWEEWVTALRAIDNYVRTDPRSNMLMVGDFNATWDNQGFATLLSDGLTDGAAARGNSLGMTWPNGAVIPAFLRIDHVLTGSRLAVTTISTHPGFGSDHRYVTATVALRPKSW